MNIETELVNKPAVLHVEPVLPVKDVVATVAYWHEVLGFPDHWTYGEPPNHGGVSWHGGAFIQFGLNPTIPDTLQGYSIWIRVRDLKGLYTFHQSKNANIVAPIEDKPWGMAEYAVMDINGYRIYFSEPSGNKAKTEKLPRSTRVVARRPTLEEYVRLMISVGWLKATDESKEKKIPATVFAVVAEDTETNTAVGCALLLGDKEGFYYVKDVVVDPSWQGRRVGTAMMRTIMEWLEAHAPNEATVGLFTGDHLAGFYRQFGFIQACGMYQQIVRKKH